MYGFLEGDQLTKQDYAVVDSTSGSIQGRLQVTTMHVESGFDGLGCRLQSAFDDSDKDVCSKLMFCVGDTLMKLADGGFNIVMSAMQWAMLVRSCGRTTTSTREDRDSWTSLPS